MSPPLRRPQPQKQEANPSSSEMLHLLARVAATSAVWVLLTKEYQEILIQKIVLCVGLWHISSRKRKQLITNSSEDTSKPKPRRKVSFGQMEILEFPSLLGDNPSVKEGAPITLDWKPVRKSIKQVDLVPDRRGPHRAPRALTPTERELLLLSKGYSMLEIEQASHHHKIGHSRQNPFLNLKSKVRNLVVNRRGSLHFH